MVKDYYTMQELGQIAQRRSCATCSGVLPTTAGNEWQSGYICCDEYYCDADCLDKSFKDSGETWAEHYSDDGECYWTEWHLIEELEA